MRFTVWLVGALEILSAIMFASTLAPRWGWVWVGATIAWCFVGCALLVSWLVQLVKSRLGGVKLPGLKAGKGSTPPTREAE